ncbi:MAG: FeS cluster assembly protein SufD [Syntrophomonadaceae bacterium]|nr:FeS cluster assembly protein SufD [Bacillota bacterium]
MAYPRNLIVLGAGSSVQILETFTSSGGDQAFTNLVSEVYVEEKAHLEYIKLQVEGNNATQINHTEIVQQKESTASVFTYTLSGGMVRNNLTIRIKGENAVGNMVGLYLLSGKTHCDNHTLVVHLVPNCESNELYKGVMNDESTGVFNGKIFVRKDAQKTNAFQSNRNILLSDDATCDTKPQLEIFADDVKCSHGCTIGSLDQEPLFYLRSRGIDENSAKALLLHAFAAETLENISIEPVKKHLSLLIDKVLGFELD